MTTHPPLFTEAGEPLEAEHWIYVIRVQVWAPVLHGGAEDSLHHAVAAW
jgi:hypothetical protein